MRALHRLGIAAAAGLLLAGIGVSLPQVLDRSQPAGTAAPQARTASSHAPAARAAASSRTIASTAPKAAPARRKATPVAPAAPDAVAPAPVLEAMQRDLGLSADQAVIRVIQEDEARTIDQDLRSRLGDAYAGSYLSPDGGVLTVAVTDAAAARTVEDADAIPAVVALSQSTLEETTSALDRQAAQAVPDGVWSWYVDVAANTVSIVARDQAAATAFADAAGVAPAAYRVTVSDEQPQPLADIRGGDAFYINNMYRCSVGFSVEGGFVTAGHCGDAGATVAGFNRAAAGVFKASNFPGTDFAFVQTNAGWTPQPWVKDAAGGNVQVAGSQEAVVGATVCRSGASTGWHCGTIQSKNATVSYPEGRVSGLTRTNACADHGDSGGAWISGQQAQGVTSGGNGNCTAGGTTYFQPLNPILSTYGLRLKSTVAAPAPATPPAPTTPVPTTPAPTKPAPVPAPSTGGNPPSGNPPAAGRPAPGQGTSAAICSAYHKKVRASVGSSRYLILPAKGQYSAKASVQRACAGLAGPVRIHLFLQKWVPRKGWVTVVSAKGGSSSTAVGQATTRARVSAGRYRYIVYIPTGARTFTFGTA
ncbi:MAG: S1 family peptidase [Kineosporiaceae bacterium]|nr:S1 family peptidase [Kineosporiaceae bacterium]